MKRVSSSPLTDLHAENLICDQPPSAAKERCRQPNPLRKLNRKVVHKEMRMAAGPTYMRTYRLTHLTDCAKRHGEARKPCTGMWHPLQPALAGENRTRAAMTAARED
jgi:hypothetical protein